jgi:hypothetical protein
VVSHRHHGGSGCLVLDSVVVTGGGGWRDLTDLFSLCCHMWLSGRGHAVVALVNVDP